MPVMKRGWFYKERGFTLIELVLIMAIVAVVGVVVSIGMGGLNSSRLNGAARRLISDLRFAQQAAITKRIRHGVIFTANSYTVFENDNTADPARNPQGGDNFIVDFTTGEFAGVTVSLTDLTDGVVRFDPAGRPLEGNPPNPVTALTTPKTVTLSYNGNPQAITIVQETGKVN